MLWNILEKIVDNLCFIKSHKFIDSQYIEDYLVQSCIIGARYFLEAMTTSSIPWHHANDENANYLIRIIAQWYRPVWHFLSVSPMDVHEMSHLSYHSVMLCIQLNTAILILKKHFLHVWKNTIMYIRHFATFLHLFPIFIIFVQKWIS